MKKKKETEGSVGRKEGRVWKLNEKTEIKPTGNNTKNQLWFYLQLCCPNVTVNLFTILTSLNNVLTSSQNICI